MKILLVSDAWCPHDHALVPTLVALVRELQAAGHDVEVLHPGRVRHARGPKALGIDLAWPFGGTVAALVQAADADAIHIVTEGPLGGAARRHCLRQGLAFTSSCIMDWPERLHTWLGVPPGWTAAALRRFHRPSQRVLVADAPAQARWLAGGLRQVRCWQPGVDTRLFTPAAGAGAPAALGPLAHPVSLYVGPVSHEQGIEDFLTLDVPGSKLVCGTGPQLGRWRQRHPAVHWFGTVPRHLMARVYAAADVLVVPAREGPPPPAVLEALACGTPVAARPHEGMLACFGQSPAAALRSDLHEAWSEALRVPRHVARDHALRFSWQRAARRFVAELEPLPRPVADRAVPALARGTVSPARS